MNERIRSLVTGFEPPAFRKRHANVDPSTEMDGTCQQLVARALHVKSYTVQIIKTELSPSKHFRKIRGTSHGVRFFAKAYLADSHPFKPRLELPWEQGASPAVRTRSIEEQIDTEWGMTHVMRELAGPYEVRCGVGKSNAARTIVWGEAPGNRVDRLIEQTRWADPKGKLLARAISKAGTWLARVHQASFQGNQSLDTNSMQAKFSVWLQDRGLANSRYGNIALRIIDDSIRNIGKESIAVPVVLTHGDYCTSNLIWHQESHRLSVIDFEHSGYRMASYDLISFLFSLRVHMLNPWVPKAAVNELEESFWNGYGAIHRSIYTFVNAVASAMVFYCYLPRVSSRRRRRGWWAGLEAFVYKSFFESPIIVDRLGISPGLLHARVQ